MSELPHSAAYGAEDGSKSSSDRLQGYAGSELPQGPFLENNLFALKVGLRWGFVNGLKWVQKWVFGSKNGSKVGRNPLFTHFKPISGFSRKPTFQPV